MQTAMMQTTKMPGAIQCRNAVAGPSARSALPLRNARVMRIVRAQAGNDLPEAQGPASDWPRVEVQSSTSGASAAIEGFPFSTIQEAINSRAAMLGFVTAVAMEVATGQSVLSQLAGKYVDEELVEKAIGASDLSYFFVVAVVTIASFAPLIYTGEKPGSRSFGPFTPALETKIGRVAQMGFLGLVVVELLKGNTALF